MKIIAIIIFVNKNYLFWRLKMFDMNRPEKEIISEFKEKLSSDSAWVKRAIIRIYEYQTEDEQILKKTNENNGIGFTGIDAGILSSFAEQIKKGNKLSEKQLLIAYKKMPKYAKQLYKICKTK